MKKLIVLLFLVVAVMTADCAPNYSKRCRKNKRSTMIHMVSHSGKQNQNKAFVLYVNDFGAPKVPVWYPAYKMLRRNGILK